MEKFATFSKHNKSNKLHFYQSNRDLFIELRNNKGLLIDCFAFNKKVFKKQVIDKIKPEED